MLKKEQILKVLKKYGFYSLNRPPYLYQAKEEIGVYFIWPNKHYGNLERVIYFASEDTLEDEVFKYWWFINNKDKVSIEVEFDSYEVLNPKVLYKYRGKILTSSLMKNFYENENNFEDAKGILKKKQLLRTANILILVLKEKIKTQNETYYKVVDLSEELKKVNNEYNKKLKEYQNEKVDEEEAYEILMDDQDESEKLINALFDELALLDTVEEIRGFIDTLFTYFIDLEASEAHLQNIYLLNRYPFEIEDIKKKINVLNEALKTKRKLFKPKQNVMEQILEIENNSQCKKMININLFIEKEKKRVESKYKNRDTIDENVLGDYLMSFEKVSFQVPEMIEMDVSSEELTKEELLKKLKSFYNKLSKKEKSACIVASSFLKDCLNILISKNAINELNTNEVISKLILDNEIDVFNEAYSILDNYINAKIRVKYFSILKINTFETFISSLIEVLHILNNLNFSLENPFYGYYTDKSKGIITLYLKNIFNYNHKTSYIATLIKAPLYYSPINIVKQLDIIDNNELIERENDTLFLLKDKIDIKSKQEKKVVVKYEKDKIIKRKDYVVISAMKEKTRCDYYEDMLYNKNDGGFYE